VAREPEAVRERYGTGINGKRVETIQVEDLETRK